MIVEVDRQPQLDKTDGLVILFYPLLTFFGPRGDMCRGGLRTFAIFPRFLVGAIDKRPKTLGAKKSRHGLRPDIPVLSFKEGDEFTNQFGRHF